MTFSVMLVDDEQFTRQGLRALIDWQSCGMEVIEEADNGEDALQLILEKKPDIVITDIRMPVLDGLELIRKVTSEHREIAPAFIIISGYNDFKYAQQAVRYGVHDFILKPIDQEEMTETLIGLSKKLRADQSLKAKNEELLISSMIETLIKGEASEETIAEWEGRMKHAQLYQYLFIELNDVHPWENSPVSFTPNEFKQQTQETIRKLLADFNTVYMHEHRGRLGLMVTDVLLSRYEGNIVQFIQELHDELTRMFDDRVFIYVGKPVDQLSKLHESYRAAKDALLYKYMYDDTKIVNYEDIRDRELVFIESDRTLFNQLLDQLEEHRIDELKVTIDQLFDEFRTKGFAPEAIKMNIHQCVTNVVNLIKELNGDERTLVSLEPILSWHDLNLSLQELKRLYTNFMTESSDYLKQLRREYGKGGIHQIKNYIDQNFHKNISLKSIASEFYMNSVYLGQLFKKHYGVYFNEYLLGLRIQEAKKLLRQTDLRIYEIAEKVGFSNADYFVTQFEKIEKMTPSEYRNKLIQ